MRYGYNIMKKLYLVHLQELVGANRLMFPDRRPMQPGALRFINVASPDTLFYTAFQGCIPIYLWRSHFD
jgi:hypothetical protein